MALFALRDIEPGEELTYDYNFSLFNPAEGQVGCTLINHMQLHSLGQIIKTYSCLAQPCKCDSEDCRGVIGGKSQRITKLPIKGQPGKPNGSNPAGTQPRVGRPRKAVKCNKKLEQQTLSACELKNMTILKYQQHLNKLWQEPQMKPLTAKERTMVKDRHCFLFRNIEKVRRIRERLSIAMTPSSPTEEAPPPPPPAPLTPAVAPVVTNVNPLALPSSMNPSVFLTRIQALRAPKEESTKRQVEDNPELSKKERLNVVFKALFKTLISVTGM